jgi:hypothetical protein
MSFSKPVTPEVLAALPQHAAELQMLGENHADGPLYIFDLYLHSLGTCPFLAYIPAYLAHDRKSADWAKWLLDWLRLKHKETHKRLAAILSPGYNCKCDEQLIGA